MMSEDIILYCKIFKPLLLKITITIRPKACQWACYFAKCPMRAIVGWVGLQLSSDVYSKLDQSK